MQNQGKVVGFTKYTREQLEKMRQDLRISMSVPQLLYCASYYRAKENRDPLIAELKMLDSYAVSCSHPLLSVAPTELMTNDAPVAETYADLMSKRRTLQPSKNQPCTLGELLGMGNACLAHIGKKNDDTSSVFQGTTEVKQNGVRSSNGRFVLREGTARKKEVRDRTFWAILFSKAGADSTDALLCDPLAAPYVLQSTEVGSAGLMEALVCVADGLWIDLSRLSQAGEEVPVSVMTGYYEGCTLVRLAGRDVNRLTQLSLSHGIRVAVFASVSEKPVFTFAHGKETLFSLDTAFLRALSPRFPMSLRPADEQKSAAPTLLHDPLSAATCPYLYEPDGASHRETATLGERICATATAIPEKDFFQAAIDTFLAPLMTLAANGCKTDGMRISPCLALPSGAPDPTSAGECLSLALGLYRAQAELGLPTAPIKTVSHDAPHAELTVFATAKGERSTPTSFTGIGNRIYCIAPDAGENGLPDFHAFSMLLSYISDLRANGILKSARVLCGQSVTDGLAEMSHGKIGYRMTHLPIAAQGALPLAFLIEASAPIAARAVGVTAERPLPDLTEAFPVLPQGESLIWSERPQVTLVATRDDSHASVLCEYLTDKGASVLLRSDCPAKTDELARAILGSQFLILCKTLSTKDSPRLQFALDTFVRSGGRILLLNRSEGPDGYPVFRYPCGIDTSLIEQICTNPR